MAFQEHRIKGPHGPVRIFHFAPAQTAPGSAGPGPAPALLLLHEAFGASYHFLGLAENLAQEGFEVFLPDLYTRQSAIYGYPDENVARAHALTLGADKEARIAALSPQDHKALDPILAWFAERDASGFLDDALAAAAWARSGLEPEKGLAAWGFCLGGGLVGQLAAAAAPIDAGIIFYGRVPEDGKVDAIRVPLLGHYAETDPSITPLVPAFAERLRRNGTEFRYAIHPGTRHGFFNDTRPAYHEQAADAAWESTREFLKQHARRSAQGPEGKGDAAPDEGVIEHSHARVLHQGAVR